MITYTREQRDEAQRLWEDYSEEWTPWRRLAQEQGIMFPPHGTAHDSWDENPSQRALVYQAIRETPDMLGWAIRGIDKPTWREVVGRVIAGRQEMRDQIDLDPDPIHPDLSPGESTQRLADIMRG